MGAYQICPLTPRPTDTLEHAALQRPSRLDAGRMVIVR
jgi:hypothetical protein